jgi:hypothetical protein
MNCLQFRHFLNGIFEVLCSYCVTAQPAIKCAAERSKQRHTIHRYCHRPRNTFISWDKGDPSSTTLLKLLYLLYSLLWQHVSTLSRGHHQAIEVFTKHTEIRHISYTVYVEPVKVIEIRGCNTVVLEVQIL